jgi:hypothetical protein
VADSISVPNEDETVRSESGPMNDVPATVGSGEGSSDEDAKPGPAAATVWVWGTPEEDENGVLCSLGDSRAAEPAIDATEASPTKDCAEQRSDAAGPSAAAANADVPARRLPEGRDPSVWKGVPSLKVKLAP